MPLQVELGLQSIHEETSKHINRAHDLACFDDAVVALRKRNIEGRCPHHQRPTFRR